MLAKNSLRGRLALLLATLLWGSSFVILKNTLESITTFYMLAIRFTCAALVMILLGFRERRSFEPGYLRGGLLMGVLLFLAYTLQTFGLLHTTPGKNAFLTASYCIMVPFLNWGIHRQRPTGANVSAALICVAGMGLVSLQNDLSIGLGELLTVGCGFFYALHIIATTRYIEGRSTILITAVQFSVVAVFSWIFALATETPPERLTPEVSGALLYLCLGCTAGCYYLQTYGQKYTPPSAVAVIMTLESVFGTIISVIFYDEKLTPRLIAGFALIFAAVLVCETRAAPKTENAG